MENKEYFFRQLAINIFFFQRIIYVNHSDLTISTDGYRITRSYELSTHHGYVTPIIYIRTKIPR